MYNKILIFQIILMIFIVCSKDKGIYENTNTADQTIEEEKNIQTGNQINAFNPQISKLKELAQLTAKEWNPEVATNFYNYFSYTKQHGMELSEIKSKFEQEEFKQYDIIKFFFRVR